MTFLSIELVPSTCWFANVRSAVTSREWDQCKMYVRDRSGDRCEICGGQGKRWPVECHEIWAYEEEPEGVYVQRLDGLIALCPRCHLVKHIGFAEIRGRMPEAMRHLMTVNNMSYEEADTYIGLCFDLWNIRSQTNWTLDISWLERELGITVKEVG